ncbi:Macrophage colony-stimulating factor 1 receptor [Knufia obscura]|uniref:Macrophage colony-stimulating factor 1 receptor n=2 Tax=Knufia TaxID=430999 RepID=A0AAN8EIH9_9EURO|nr:Macrophage colony-stimulating factor 1 receptor [Knufia obscura]KAK5950385.1 Macrophage colony-stimulating factor 1 receptor [Knufia fluminis]
MAALTGLTSQTLGSSQSFNWTWSIELVTSGILVLWFLFYLNRLFATVVSYAIRTYTWHKFRVYIDIRSLQISFLGGRIFFKGVRYHGENETVYIHNGHVTWRYWLRVTKQVDLSESRTLGGDEGRKGKNEKDETSESGSEEAASNHNSNQPEPRILASINGLEWFIYNRTPVYDAIVQEAGAKASSSADDEGLSATNAFSKAVENRFRKRSRAQPDADDAVSLADEKMEPKKSLSKSLSSSSDPSAPEHSDQRSFASGASDGDTEVSSFYSIMLRFFPLGIECAKGAVSIGNEHTKAIIVTTFDRARGHIDAAASGPADIFRQVFDFDIEHPVVQMKPNADYHLPQMAAAERIILGHEAVLKRRPWWRPSLHLTKHRRTFTHGLRNLIPLFRTSVASLHGQHQPGVDDQPYIAFADAQPESHGWHGLDRYMDEDEGDDHHAWVQIEYARFSTILDCPRVHLNFHWDTAGTVKSEHESPLSSGLAADLNGIAPPAYGMHLDVYGGLVNYGPWSDRLRVEVQNIFVPSGYKNAAPKNVLSEGETRLSTTMTITVDIKDEITLRIPSRESSKDWRWRGRATAVRDAAALRKQQQRRHFRFRRSTKRRLGPDVRPFGWISVAAGAHSKVRYVMDMYPGVDGYRNTLQLSLKHTKATSSVNHATLWECDEQQVSADLSNPLGWNHLHSWRFDIMNKHMDLFLLRDHTFLLLDLISDFTAGQKSDYMTFMPFHYTIGIKFLDLKLFLNANDNNIIDNPVDLEENAFLVLGFDRLVGQVDIPMRFFSPAQSSVKFQGDGSDAKLTLKTPTWHTLHNFGEDETMATLKALHLEGSYNYFAGTSPKLTDSLVMDIIGGTPKFHLQGYLIRYFMNVKDNYFGDTIHFSTLEEHQAKLERSQRGEDEKKPPTKKENDLDVILSVRAENAVALMPANIYSREENLKVDVLLIEADMRFTNYYMDLQVSSSPIEVSTERDVYKGDRLRRDASGCQMFIDGISVYGHRLFGAPPAEPTYLCNWDFDVGEVLGECTTDFMRILVTAVLSFVYTMDDDDNALPHVETPLIPDVTFLRMRAAGVRTWIVSADTAFLVEIAPTNVELNDWANQHFSKYVTVNSPLLLVAAVDSTSAYRQRDSADKFVPTLACIRTSMKLAVLNRKADFAHNRGLQQEHIRFHDSRTHRADWLLHKQHHIPAEHRLTNWSRQPPAMPIPPMPEPVPSPSMAKPPDTTPGIKSSSSRCSSFITTTPFAAQKQVGNQRSTGKMGGLPASVNRDAKFGAQAQDTNVRSRPTGSHPVSSRWTKPLFQLQRIQPDLKHMPRLTDIEQSVDYDSYNDSMEDDDFPATNEESVHDGIFCNLVNGIVGFCTPELIRSVVTLLNEISPERPESILDDLQMQVVSGIKKLTNKHTSQIDDLAFRLPFSQVRIVSPHNPSDADAGFDQYDIKMNGVRATVRIAPETHTKFLQPQVLTHANIRRLKLEAAECIPRHNTFNSGAEISLSDAGLWLSLGGEVRARTQINDIEVSTAGQNLNSLAGLIQRSESVVSRAVQQIRRIDLPNRTQHLLYHLTSAKDPVDPFFLSRPVNVLRTVEQHVRVHDSWKMITRLRHVLLTRLGKQHRTDDCSQNCLDEDGSKAREHILSSFDQWKIWENAEGDDDALVQAVFGPSKIVHSSQQPADIELEVLLGRAAVTLDPGPHQSQLFVQSLDLNFAEKPSHAARSSEKRRRISRVAQAYCGAVGCRLHWELINLAEKVLDLSFAYGVGQPAAEPSEAAESGPQHSVVDLLVIVGADAASLEVESDNLKLSTGVERLKASFATGTQKAEKSATSLVLSAAAARLRLRGKRRSILGCKLTVPTVFVNINDGSSVPDGKIVLHSAATCAKLRFHLKEDVLGLLQVVQALLTHEVPAVQRLAKLIPTKTKDVPATSARQPRPSKEVQPHIALFLDDYLMHFDLMTYLQYEISGTIARTSVVPRNAKELSVQLDIKETSHSFDNPVAHTDRSKSVLDMPPLTAVITLRLLPDRVVVDTKATIELMLLEASAVRACFDAAYQPQTIEYVKDIKSHIAGIRRSIDAVSPPQDVVVQESSPKVEQRLIQYAGHLVLEGVRLHCSAPASRPDQDYGVDLNVALDTTTMRIGNARPQTKSLTKKPNFSFVMQGVTVDLERVRRKKEKFGQLTTSFRVSAITEIDGDDQEVQNFRMLSNAISLDLHTETAVLAVDLVTFLQARIKSLTAAEDAKKLRPLRRLTLAATNARPPSPEKEVQPDEAPPMGLLSSTFSLEFNAICVRWLLSAPMPDSPVRSAEDMVFTVAKIDLQTRREASARLSIRTMQLQLVPQTSSDPFQRSANSALLPEMIFNAAYARGTATRKFAFKAAGKLLDVRLASNFIIPASAVQRSLALASAEVRNLKLATTNADTTSSQAQLPKLLGKRRLAQLLVFAEFGGAEVTVSPVKEDAQEQSSAFGFLKGAKRSRAGRYGQAVQSSTGEEATLRAPGIAFQVEFADNGQGDPTLSTEVRVAASSNTLAPSLVPLILEISSSVTNLMEQDNTTSQKDEDTAKADAKDNNQALQQVQASDPTAILGRVKLNAGLWVQKQEFSLTCQPIARVSATAQFDEIFVVVNTVQAQDQERFFAITTTFSNLAASVQHVYSRESTASFEVESIMVSLMNSKHFSDRSGISAILDISPMKAYLNAKQMQDFLLFREIWYPPELRAAPKAADTATGQDAGQGHVIQRFQEVTSTAVLPWHAVVSIQELKVQVDFGQSIGKADFAIEKLWASSKKNSDAEQNLCVGFNKVGMESTGRMSGFVELQGFRVRTAIRWPRVENKIQAPRVQGSVGFEHLRAKAVFDYQPFAVADISTFDFLIYNVRQGTSSDRLVGILDGGKVQAFATTAAAAQVLSISQAFERLIQEKQEAFETSLHELDRYLRRKSAFPSSTWKSPPQDSSTPPGKAQKSSHAPNLHVDVVITLRAIDGGVFMTSFFDEMTLKLAAEDVQARFAVGEANSKTHSGLGMSLGQVRLALATMSRPNAKALGEVSVTEVIDRATSARGGTILKVPRLVASMQTWQQAPSNVIEYIFSSTFHGKVDIGWNYSRISTIRRMWESHSRALAQKMNKPLPQSAIKITAEPKNEAAGGEQEKITAVVNMPQSKYEYIALEPPIIDTPQLRDLGEATPSLEWIGLQRERLPHVTHSVIIVSLLEVAKEVEDTYSRILGSG